MHTFYMRMHTQSMCMHTTGLHTQTLCMRTQEFAFFMLLNPSCIRKSLPAYACFGPRTQAATHIRGTRSALVFYFKK